MGNICESPSEMTVLNLCKLIFYILLILYYFQGLEKMNKSAIRLLQLWKVNEIIPTLTREGFQAQRSHSLTPQGVKYKPPACL